MKKYRVLIIFTICACIYLLIMLFVLDNSNKKKDVTYLVLDNQINYAYKKGKYNVVDNDEIKKINSKFDVYIDNESIGKYTLKSGNVWNLFDEDNNFEYYNGYLFATKGDVEVANVKARRLNDAEKYMLEKKYNIKIKETLNVEEVYDIYLNNNDISDKIISVSYSEVGENASEFYNIIVINIDGEIKTLLKETGQDVVSIYYIKNIFKIGKEKYNSFIVQQVKNHNGDIENYSVNDYIYRYEKNSYKKVS